MKNRLAKLYDDGRSLMRGKARESKQGQKAGLPPGSLVYVGKDRDAVPQLDMIAYTADQFREVKEIKPADIQSFKAKPETHWFNAEGVHKSAFVDAVGKAFDISPLILEDIMDTRQRPKLETRTEYLFLPIKMIRFDPEANFLQLEQVSLILGPDYVISFQEQTGDVLDPVRNRIQQSGTRVREKGAPYLFYFMVDVIVSNYFVALEQIERRIELLEDAVQNTQSTHILEQVLRLRKDILHLRKVIFPLKEIIIQLQSLDHPLLKEDNKGFFQDLRDQIFLAADNIESYRDILTNVYDMHLSLVSHRMNEIMKVLTIISTVFIPLSFLAGLYGMNFQYMPELSHPWAYPALLGLMLVIVLFLLAYFRRKGWL